MASSNTLSNPDPRNWRISSRSDSAGLYALALLDTKFTALNGAPGSTLAQAATKGPNAIEFVFNMNPKTLDLDEPASMTITPTQDGGQFVEHQGSVYKTITITGTTGLRPNRSQQNSLIPILGVPNPFAVTPIEPTTLLPPGESSGFQDFIDLRNLFRRYFDFKADPAISSSIIMVWQNGKEGEFYLVEPVSFKTKRDASNPVTFAYEIQLRTISKVTFLLERRPDSRIQRNALQQVTGTLAQIVRELSAALNTVNSLVDRTIGVAQATINEVTAPARALLDGLTGVLATTAQGLAIPRNSVALLANSAIGLMESLASFQNQVNAYTQQGISTQWALVREAAKRIQRASTRVTSQDKLFSPSIGQQFDTRASAYRNTDNDGRPPLTGGSPTDLQNVTAGNGTALATINGGDNIYTISQRLLGDQARWKELVITNNLKQPYIDPTGDGVNVLRPGDTILFPTSGGETLSGVSPTKVAQQSDLTTRLGLDLRLRAEQGAGGLPIYDIGGNPQGDLDQIEGLDNLSQAIVIKFSTEQGTLPTHPNFGVQAPIGRKVLLRSLVGFQLNTRASLLGDTRISDVRALSFQSEGNVLTVAATLDIADSDQTVTVAFDTRR